jgi:hypothetical protein
MVIQDEKLLRMQWERWKKCGKMSKMQRKESD